MNRGLYTLASGGLAMERQLDAVANNVANANTPGYKAERFVFESSPLLNGPLPPVDDPVLLELIPQVVESLQRRDFSPGPITTTGNPLDVAIGNPTAFFAVSTPRGERYTRQGTFALDAEGFLVAGNGQRVQGEGGDIRIDQREGALDIADDGTLWVDQVRIDRLRLVDFGPSPRLVPEGAETFAPVPGVFGSELQAEAVSLTQGALERSNVDPVKGVTQLVEIARGYESYMRAITRLDEIARRTIDEVGRVG
ncbi:MAG: flagellar hook-basal body protein [bacterium]|nr:flagellar hook-basal body protein [bacterium]